MDFTEDPNLERRFHQEPTVLDWFKSLLRLDPLPIPSAEEPVEVQTASPTARGWDIELPSISHERAWQLTPDKLRVPAALVLAFVAQLNLTHRVGLLPINIALYVVGAGLLVWAALAGDFSLPMPLPVRQKALELGYRWRPLAAGVVLGLITFLTAGDNQFRWVTVISWIGSMGLVLAGLWDQPLTSYPSIIARWRETVRPSGWNVSLRRWHLFVLAAFLLAAFFRLNQLSAVPYEMWSDQAEKLLDVRDVLQGDTKIFFARNSGREAIEFYWAAFIYKVFNTGLSFITLKIVSASAGLIALPFIYLFGKELAGRRVGLFGMLLAGMAFWPNITSRAGLRMPLNEMFVAPALYFLVRGIRRGERNSFLLSGLAVGLGLQGYSGARVLPLAVLLGWLVYLVHERSGNRRWRTFAAFSGLVLVSIIGVLPLLRFLVDQPDLLLYRTMTRVGTLEQQYQMNPILQLLKNMWDILTMFSWDNGQIWVVTVPGRPALDWLTGAFFHLGVVLTGLSYLRHRRWHSLFLLLLLPVLLLPSALALAFPNENPAPNRVTGAIVPVFTLGAVGVDALYRWLRQKVSVGGGAAAAAVVGLLFVGVGLRNYDLVFDNYAESQRASAWNVSEAAEVMRGFAQSIGDYDDVYLVHYPFWMDSRLVTIEAGAPIRDFSILPENISDQALDAQEYHLFFIKAEDRETMELLADLHPDGVLSRHVSEIPGRDFYLYLVPPEIPAVIPTES